MLRLWWPGWRGREPAQASCRLPKQQLPRVMGLEPPLDPLESPGGGRYSSSNNGLRLNRIPWRGLVSSSSSRTLGPSFCASQARPVLHVSCENCDETQGLTGAKG